MPRVKQVVAAKDYPKFGIVKGQKHYHWQRKTGPRSSQEYRQVEPPRIEQLTSSAYKIAMHHLSAEQGNVATRDDLESFTGNVGALAEEQRGKFDNMPEGLQQGDTGQTLEQQADALDSAVSELEDISSEWESEEEDHQSRAKAFEEYETARGEWDEESGEPQPEEVEDPGEFDPADFISRVGDVSLE